MDVLKQKRGISAPKPISLINSNMDVLKQRHFRSAYTS